MMPRSMVSQGQVSGSKKEPIETEVEEEISEPSPSTIQIGGSNESKSE